VTVKIRSRSSTWFGVFFIVFLMSALVFLPKILNKKKFVVKLDESGIPRTFPFDSELRVVSASSKGSEMTTLGKIVKQRGKSLIVNFWASWCPPCIEELPSLEFLNRQLERSKGDVPMLVLVSVDEHIEDISNLYKTLDFTPTFLVLHDPDGEVARTMGTSKFPETYLVSTTGKVLFKWVGPQDWLAGDVLQKLTLSK
jgi:thiol-disulfide isomerase/thioredoxin